MPPPRDAIPPRDLSPGGRNVEDNVHDLDKRLAVVETHLTWMKWLGGVLITAIIGLGFMVLRAAIG